MATSKQEVHACVYYQKSKLLILVAISLIFILEGIWLIDMSYWRASFAPISLRVIGALLIFFFAIPFFAYGSKLFQRVPAYIIKPDGFVDNASFVKNRFIHWDNIEGIQIYLQRISGFLQFRLNTRYVKVNLKDPNHYIENYSGFQKWFLHFNQRRYQSPILLSTTGMSITPKALFRLMEEHLVNYYQQKIQH